MDKDKSPQDMLNEIMDRDLDKIPVPPEKDDEEEAAATTPPKETAPPPEKETPPTPAGKNKPSSMYVYLAVMFGAAFLMLLLAYFVQKRNNATIQDDLRISTASREELLSRIETLEGEKESLQNDNDLLDLRLEQVKEERERYKQQLEDTVMGLSDELGQRKALEYLWYLDQFMDSKDYSMAAMAVVFSADQYFSASLSPADATRSPAWEAQYQGYRQKLIDKGYLQELDHDQDTSTNTIWFADLWFAEKYDPTLNDGMAALGIFWCALDQYYVQGNPEAAAQYLYQYPLKSPGTGYQERVQRLTGGFAREQFQALKDALVETGYLTVAEDGSMAQGPGDSLDMLYPLPFEPPITWENGNQE